MPQTPADRDHSRVSRPGLEALFCCTAAAFAYLMTFRLPCYPVFYENDTLIFAYEGWRFFNGDVIYRDVFEFTFPGTQLFYAAEYGVFGVRYWVASANVVLLAAASSWTCLKVSKALIPNTFYWLPPIMYMFFGFRWFGIDASHRMFSPIFLMLAVWMLLRGRSGLHLVGAGALCAAAAFFTQQRGLVMLVTMCCFVAADALIEQAGVKKMMRRLALLCLPFATVTGGLCAYFVFLAGAGNFLYATFVYPALYYSYGTPNSYSIFPADLVKAFDTSTARHIFGSIPVLFYDLILPAGVLLTGLFMLSRKPWTEWTEWRRPVLVLAVAAALIVTTTAPNQYRLYQVSALPLIIVVWLLSNIMVSERLRRYITMFTAGALLCLGCIQAARFQTLELSYWSTPTGVLAAVQTPQMQRYFFLSQRLAPRETFFEVYEPFLYFPLQLRNPTRYGQIWPTDYTRPEHVAEAVHALEADPPRYILWDNGYIKADPDREPGDHTGPLARFVEASYTPVGPVYDIDNRAIQVWERKDISTSPLQP